MDYIERSLPVGTVVHSPVRVWPDGEVCELTYPGHDPGLLILLPRVRMEEWPAIEWLVEELLQYIAEQACQP